MLAVLYDKRFLNECRRNRSIACVITTPDLAVALPDRLGVAVSKDPRGAFLRIHRHLWEATDFYGPRFSSEVDSTARVHSTATVAENNVRIGRGAEIGPGAIVLEGACVGSDSVIGPGALIGTEGFSPTAGGSEFTNTPHSGGLRIGTRVVVQANSVVCRGAYSGSTEIGDGSIVSSLVNVSHNVRIGRSVRVGAGACLLGSSRLGDHVWVGPNATISNRVRVGIGARVSLGSVVVRDVEPGETVSGNFAMPHAKFLHWFRRVRSDS